MHVFSQISRVQRSANFRGQIPESEAPSQTPLSTGKKCLVFSQQAESSATGSVCVTALASAPSSQTRGSGLWRSMSGKLTKQTPVLLHWGGFPRKGLPPVREKRDTCRRDAHGHHMTMALFFVKRAARYRCLLFLCRFSLSLSLFCSLYKSNLIVCHREALHQHEAIICKI